MHGRESITWRLGSGGYARLISGYSGRENRIVAYLYIALGWTVHYSMPALTAARSYCTNILPRTDQNSEVPVAPNSPFLVYFNT